MVLVEASTRDAVLDALDTLMARQGFRKTTVDEVAKEARVGRRTVYLHFASKEDLGLSSIDRVVAIHEDGRGWIWDQINHCGEVVFDGQPAPADCPPAPEGY